MNAETPYTRPVKLSVEELQLLQMGALAAMMTASKALDGDESPDQGGTILRNLQRIQVLYRKLILEEEAAKATCRRINRRRSLADSLKPLNADTPVDLLNAKIDDSKNGAH